MLKLIVALILAVIVLTGADQNRKMITAEAPFQIFATAESRVALTLTERRGDLLEVTAIVTPNEGEVRSIRMAFYDGERTTVVLPGQPDTRFHFHRQGARIAARVEE